MPVLTSPAVLRKGRAEVAIDPFGATVTRWRVDGRDLLYMSPIERMEGKPFRGGIPLVFPVFGACEQLFPGRQHGFVRNRVWAVVEQSGATATFRLQWTKKEWPTYPGTGTLLMTVTLTEESLLLEVDTSKVATPFQFLFHTYLAADWGHSRIEGLGGMAYDERAPHNVHTGLQSAGDLAITEEVDRIYQASSVTLRRGDNSKVLVESNLPQTVVWNPATTKKLGDLPADGYRRFVCLESGHVVGAGTYSTVQLKLTYTV